MQRLEATIESLIRENGELRRRVDDATEAEEILRRAQAPPVVMPRQPAHKRPNPAGLHVVRGVVAAGGAAVGWIVRSRAHKAATFALMAAVAAGAGTQSVITGTAPSAPARAHHARAVTPPLVSPARKRRRASGSEATPGASPSPSPSAVPPSRRPEDEPSPMATVTPLPSPSPLCTKLTGNGCAHNPNCACGGGDGDADDVLAAA
jgi:hypothetical protein